MCVCVCKKVFLDSLAEQQSDVFRGDISSLCGYKFYAFSFYTPSLNLNLFFLPFLTKETLIMVCILFLPEAGLSSLPLLREMIKVEMALFAHNLI